MPTPPAYNVTKVGFHPLLPQLSDDDVNVMIWQANSLTSPTEMPAVTATVPLPRKHNSLTSTETHKGSDELGRRVLFGRKLPPSVRLKRQFEMEWIYANLRVIIGCVAFFLPYPDSPLLILLSSIILLVLHL